MEPLTMDAEVLLTSLLSEAPSLWLDDHLSDHDGGKSPFKPLVNEETSDLFSELEQDSSLLGDTDPLPEWMSEQVSLTSWLEVADTKPSDLLMESSLPSVPAKLDLPTTTEIPIPTQELLDTLFVDTRFAPQPPSPGEAQGPDLLALSPASSLLTEDGSFSFSPLSPSIGSPQSGIGSPQSSIGSPQSSIGSPQSSIGSPQNSIGSPQCSIGSPASPADNQQVQAEPIVASVGGNLTTIDFSELLQNVSPMTVTNKILLTLNDGSPVEVEVVVEPPAAETPKKKSRAKPKVKSVSNPVIKKSKKRDQNKRAATRYRQKKRSEQELLDDEREILETTNNELNDKVDSISREIKYLKDLLAEVYKVKGEIKVLRNK